MQKALSILLIFALAVQTFSGWETLAGFELHRNYIAKYLCVNRDDPSINCNGKCYLKKALQKDHQHKSGENGTAGSRLEINLFCSTEQFRFSPDIRTSIRIFSPLRTAIYPPPYFSFFHPPKLLIGSLFC